MIYRIFIYNSPGALAQFRKTGLINVRSQRVMNLFIDGLSLNGYKCSNPPLKTLNSFYYFAYKETELQDGQ